MASSLPILYVKPHCPWCTEALAFFAKQGVALDVRDVVGSMHEMRELVAHTGQSKCPSLRFGDFVFADFSVDELLAKLRKHPEVAQKLGIKL